MKKAFSLVELMIVVAIIGILAALVIPKISNYAQQAKEAAARENLQVLRGAIELYASQHGGIPPGYPNNDASGTPPNQLAFALHMVKSTNAAGAFSHEPTPGFPFGPYMRKLPANPFNGSSGVKVYENSQSLPASAPIAGPDLIHGWMYHPATKTIRLNVPGTDSSGNVYWSY